MPPATIGPCQLLEVRALFAESGMRPNIPKNLGEDSPAFTDLFWRYGPGKTICDQLNV